MLKIVALYLCWTIFLVSGDGNGSPQVVGASSPLPTVKNEKLIPEPTSVTTIAPNTTTTVKPTPPKPDNITTTSPAPIPPKPDNTTTTTTLAPIPDTNTTTTSTTTPTPPITTLSPPTTPAPAPKAGHWIYNTTNATCIVIQMSVQFKITYLTTANETASQLLTLPTENNTTVTGDCGTTEQTITISWNGNNSMSLHFVKNDTTKKYYVHHVEVSLLPTNFPNITSNTTLNFVHEPETFETGFAHSYRCMKEQTVKLSPDPALSNKTLGVVDISDLQFEAFKTDKAGNFGLAQDCQSADVPDVVPIVVGCVLTALVIMVLAAYLVGRRRSQARGYLSM